MVEKRKETKRGYIFFTPNTNTGNGNNSNMSNVFNLIIILHVYDGVVKLKQATEFLKCIEGKFVL